MANISKIERARRANLTDEELAAEGLNRPKTSSGGASKFKQAEKASKKYTKILGRENAALDRATSSVRERFQLKKDAFLGTLSDEVKTLVLTSDYSQTEVIVDNPDVSDTELDEVSNG